MVGAAGIPRLQAGEDVNTNLADVRSRLSGLEKQVNFASSKALNDTAREERKPARRKSWPQSVPL